MKTKLLVALLLITIALVSVQPTNAEEMKQYESNGLVEFIPNLDPTLPVDPENPDPENPVAPIDPIDPDGSNLGTQGPLSIDFASSFDFGKNRISSKNQVYYAKAQTYHGTQPDTANFVQVSDNRGTNSGWILKVKQEGEFTSTTDTLNRILTGAQITLTNSTVNSNALNVVKPVAEETVTLKVGEESLVTAAAEGAGAGTWATYWGRVEAVEERDELGTAQTVNVTKAVQLSIPGSTPKDEVKYQTRLVWSLTDVPGN